MTNHEALEAVETTDSLSIRSRSSTLTEFCASVTILPQLRKSGENRHNRIAVRALQPHFTAIPPAM
jgi:hypothetical protein